MSRHEQDPSSRSRLAAWRRFLTLDPQLAAARARRFRPGDAGWQQFDLAVGALAGARLLRETARGGGAVLLLRWHAAVLLVLAHLARAGSVDTAGRAAEHLRDTDWAAFMRLPGSEEHLRGLSEQQRELVRTTLTTSMASGLTRLGPGDRQALGRALARFVEALARELRADAGQEARLLAQRETRVGLAGALALALFVAAVLLVVHGSSILRPSANVALGRPVQVSAAAASDEHEPQALTDGDRIKAALHSQVTTGPRIDIDLERSRTIRRIMVFNRTDCCQPSAVPLRLELSADGHHYERVGRRDEPFDVWTADFEPTEARHVRLTVEGTTALHLTEVEVY